MKRGRPINPNELKEITKKKNIKPKFIFDIFNDLIQKEALIVGLNKTITVKQDDVCERINEEHGSTNWPIWWLDIEKDYENENWNVNYDKPAYCDDYDACFYFKRK